MADQPVVDVATQLTKQLDRAVRRINSKGPAPAKVSTMTITACLNVERVCKESLQIALHLVDGDGPFTCEPKSRKRKRPATFYNQITVRYLTKSIKVFHNGSMHVTGCTSPTQFLEVASAVCKLMEDVAGIESDDGGPVRVKEFAVQMINLNFGAGKKLFLQKLRDECTALGFTASYDADVYPGLNVKFEVDGHRMTALIFKSGKVIVSGAKTPDHMEKAHRMIMDVLRK